MTLTDAGGVEKGAKDDIERLADYGDSKLEGEKGGFVKMEQRGKLGLYSVLAGIGAFVGIFISMAVGWIPCIGRFCGCFLSIGTFLCALGAIVLGIAALVSKKEKSKVLGAIGLILGILYFLLMIVMLILSIIVMALLFFIWGASLPFFYDMVLFVVP